MPRRPGERRGDADKIETKAVAAQMPAPPQLLGSHFHRGTLVAAPLHPKLKALLTLWQEKRGQRDELPVYALKDWAAHLALLEPMLGNFRFRLGGAALVERFGVETVGRTLDVLAPDLRKALLGLLDLAASKQRPVAASTVLRSGGKRVLWSELMLPLAGGRAGPPLLLLGAYPIRLVPP
ncbi:MAG TPA: hypothetical protein VGF56_03725 [Rhizomicrobium sp.]|jgi:hypothetical protein